jgi:serine/threonine protein kinase
MQELAGYEIERELGRQAGRRTLLGRDRATGDRVVIKLLLLGDEFDWQSLKLFEREAATLQRLEHPAIPRYVAHFDLETPEGHGFALVQRYVEGRSLADWVQAGRSFSEAEVQELAEALLHILIELHQHQPPVIHRDIKPSNIVLGDRSGNSVGTVHLVDFGSVQTAAAQEGGTITVVGTYGYMPPEQFGGRVSPSSDLYGLGATLIFLVTGRHPSELPQTELQLQFRSFTSVSAAFADWLEWLTQPNPHQRPSSATEALNRLHHPLPADLAQPTWTPPSSDIVLRDYQAARELLIPRRKVGFVTLGLVSLGIPCLILLLFYESYEVGRTLSQEARLVLIGLIGLMLLLPLGYYQWLRFEAESIVLIQSWLGLRYPAILLKKAHITEVSAVYRTSPYGFTSLERVILSAKERKIVLKRWNFAEEELAWLAQNLSQELGVPLRSHTKTQ